MQRYADAIKFFLQLADVPSVFENCNLMLVPSVFENCNLMLAVRPSTFCSS